MDHAKDVDALEQRINELCYAERYRDAESILRELLDRLREVTLPDEKRIMRTLHNLACVLFQQSKLVSVPAGNDSALDSAAAVLRTLLQMQVSLLGPGHEDVLETKRNLDEVQRTFDELPDMPLEEAEATAEATSDDAAAVREGCGGDERTAESLPTETLRDPSFAATVEAVHRQLSSNPTEEEFEGAKVRLSEALRTFFEWPDKQETQNRASFHMEELYALQRRLRRKVGGVMGRPARIDDRFGRHLFFKTSTNALRVSHLFRRVLHGTYGAMTMLTSSGWTRTGSPSTSTTSKLCITDDDPLCAEPLHTAERDRMPTRSLAPRCRKLATGTSANFGSILRRRRRWGNGLSGAITAVVATAIAMPAARAMEPRSTATTADEHVKKRRHTQGETSRTFRTWPSMTYLRR